MCGEPCPKKCRICDKDELTEILFGEENEENEPEARFVELQPCGHVIAVKAMDRYMDDVSENNSSIQLKGCPRCKTPIRTTLRYGNIINSTLADLEKVKTKLIVPSQNLQMESMRLKKKLLCEKFNPKLREYRHNVFELFSKEITTEQLNMYENQINFLCFLSKVMTSSGIIKSPLRMMIMKRMKLESITEALAEPLLKRIAMLRGWLSDQEKEEINDELLRLSLVTSYNIFVHQLSERQTATLKLGHISDAIDSCRRIGKDEIDRYVDEIKELATRYGLAHVDRGVTDQEKNMIVKAMGMAQGHWFKCPKGHIYCIGECGGATVEVKCPECG